MEVFNYEWNEYNRNIKKMFHNLLDNNIFSDIVLVCEDKVKLFAHKLMLSGRSSLFKAILDEPSQPSVQPFIYLKGIKSEQMKSILEFIYLGKTKISQDEVNDFLEAAAELEIEGIYGNNDQNDYGVDIETEENDMITGDTLANHEDDEITEDNQHFDIKQEVVYDENITEDKNEADIGNEEEEDTKTEVKKTRFRPKATCPECNKVFSTQGNMSAHYKRIHQGVKLPCTKCDYQATQAAHLRIHMDRVHNGVYKKCDYCDYKSKSADVVKKHMKARHTSDITINGQ